MAVANPVSNDKDQDRVYDPLVCACIDMALKNSSRAVARVDWDGKIVEIEFLPLQIPPAVLEALKERLQMYYEMQKRVVYSFGIPPEVLDK